MKSLYSNINTVDEEIRESGRNLLPPESVESFAMNGDVDNLGEVGSFITFANPDTIGQCRLNPDANNHQISGLVAPSVGKPNKRIVVTNISPSGYDIRVLNNNAGSSAGNRILLDIPVRVIRANDSMIFQYDTIDSRYRLISKD